MKKSTLFAIVMAVLCLMGCNNKKEHESHKHELGKFIYIDVYKVLHTNNNCEEIAEPEYGGKPVVFYSLSDIEGSEWRLICSQCVNDEQYEKIINAIK